MVSRLVSTGGILDGQRKTFEKVTLIVAFGDVF